MTAGSKSTFGANTAFTPWSRRPFVAASARHSPAPVPREVYMLLLQRAWRELLASPSARDERVIQDFFERHPALVPGAFSVDGESGHGPWPRCVVRQPPLPELSTKRPDFLWIATDSETVYPVLVEIETPHKRWWHSDGEQSHSDFTHAHGQLADWRAWFSEPRNQIAFLDFYEVPSLLRRRSMEPRFVLVHGRREEASRDRMRERKRGQLKRPDERLMTFDRIEPHWKSLTLGCATITAQGYELTALPPSFEVVDWHDDRYMALDGWGSALARSDMDGSRGQFIVEEVDRLRSNFPHGRSGPRRPNTR